MSSPFLPGNEGAYQAWRSAKLAVHPQSLQDLIVKVVDPRRLTKTEHAALLDRCQRANMAIYSSDSYLEGYNPDKAIPREFARQFGLEHLDCNLLADEDGITSLAVSAEKGRGGFHTLYQQAHQVAHRWLLQPAAAPDSRHGAALCLCGC